MTRISMTAAAAVLVAFSGVAAAQQAGDIVFTTQTGGVFWLPQGGSAVQLAQINEPNVRLADLAFGPSGALFVNNGPQPVGDPSLSNIYRIQDPFGAANVSVFASSGNIQNPIGLVYDRPTNNMIAVMNPGTNQPRPDPSFLGLLGVNATTGATAVVYQQQPAGTTFPYYNRGAYISAVPGQSGTYVSAAVQGSAFDYNGVPPQTRASSLHRFTMNGMIATEELIVDLGDTSVTGFSRSIGRVTGVTAVDAQTMFISSVDYPGGAGTGIGSIFRVDLDLNGDFLSVTDITTGNLPTGVNIFPEEIEYNKFTNTLFFADRIGNADGTASIYELNLDGTGLNSVYVGFGVRGIAIIPTPAGVALLALGGLVAARRRRA